MLEMEALQGKTACQKQRNCPPSANQAFLLRSPDNSQGHAVCTLWVPPTVLPFLLTQNVSPKDIAGCAIPFGTMGPLSPKDITEYDIHMGPKDIAEYDIHMGP